VVDGGLRANVVAPAARALVDVRVRTSEDADRVEQAIRSLAPVTEGVVLHVQGGMGKAPMERTPRNRALWRLASEVGRELNLELEEAFAGGGSDGNTISQHTATLDGLGSVGDGAHALHEHIRIDASLERCALLTRLLLTGGGP
jgi:glutamate carboxypeptidase